VKVEVIRARSVGFRPLEVELPSREDGKDGTTLIFKKQELVEFSICNVPANPFALAKMAIAETKQDLCSSNSKRCKLGREGLERKRESDIRFADGEHDRQ
jgi:phage head maturation protease